MVIILDYGIGNVTSILNMLKRIGIAAQITDDIALIKEATKLILPGVGHFEYCMSQLRKAPFYDLIQYKVQGEKVPVLGVCVGCQMLMEGSEEGNVEGLGWIKGRVIKFDINKMPAGYKIPHMNWTEVNPQNHNFLYKGIAEPRFYFVHSYHVVCDDPSAITATADYGYSFPASIAKDNIIGVQFHPEKSHKFGMQLYQNFASFN